MLASYSFNSDYHPTVNGDTQLPSLRLLEGGKFFPQQFSPVLVKEYGQIRLKFFRWGLVPAWVKQNSQAKVRAWAPAEHLFHNPAYHLPIRRQRCLIPADGFYMDASITGEQYKVSPKEARTFCFAGIFDSWQKRDGSLQHSFAIITTPSQVSMSRFGLQMPLVLSKQAERLWLNPQASMNKIEQLLYPKYHEELVIHLLTELVDTTIKTSVAA